jgi:Fic family protein
MLRPIDAVIELEWLRRDRDRLLKDLSKAHGDIVPWIEKSARFDAMCKIYEKALQKIHSTYGDETGEDARQIAIEALKDAAWTSKS